jgi:hypothetical protein
MKKDDLISRVAALEALGECPYNRDDWPEEIQAVDDWKSHKEAIESIPAVDAAPVVHARWILVQNGSGVCSACNRNDHIDSLAAYCRYCGAKMDGEREDEHGKVDRR